MLEHVLAAVGVADRRMQLLRQREHLVARGARPVAAVDGDLLGLADELDGALERGVRRAQQRALLDDRMLEHLVLDLGGADIARQYHHPHAAVLDRGLHGELRQARHLLRRGDRADEGAAVREDLLRRGLLEVVAADLGARDVRCDREYGSTVALAIVEAVEQMEAARARRAEHRRRPPGDLCRRARGERAGFLVAHVHELDVGLVAPHRIDDRVRRVPDDPEDLRDPGLDHQVDEGLRNGLGHTFLSERTTVCRTRSRLEKQANTRDLPEACGRHPTAHPGDCRMREDPPA